MAQDHGRSLQAREGPSSEPDIGQLVLTLQVTVAIPRERQQHGRGEHGENRCIHRGRIVHGGANSERSGREQERHEQRGAGEDGRTIRAPFRTVIPGRLGKIHREKAIAAIPAKYRKWRLFP